MGKFSSAKPAVVAAKTLPSPIKTGERTVNAEGSTLAFSRDAKSDLFLLAVVNMVGEDTFYESASARDDRFRSLIHQVSWEDPDWIAGFVPYLRNSMHMRSASIVMAAESAWARLHNEGRKTEPSATTVRSVISSAISRADEPAELLAYWVNRYGRSIPSAIKRGLGDAMNRILNEYSAMKYDGNANAWRIGDVIELTHVKPTDEHQAALYRWLIDARQGNDTPGEILAKLPMIAKRKAVAAIPATERRGWLTQDHAAKTLKDAGMTWEDLSGWLGGALDAKFWESVIPSMGYMALLRNLRNFDEKGISAEARAQVIAFLTDPVQIANSKQFPFRFWSAYKATNSLHYAQALETAMNGSVSNIPALPGRSLVLIDTSSSMTTTGYSARSTIMPVHAAGIFGLATALKSEADIFTFASGAAPFPVPKGEALLKSVERLERSIGSVGHGTDIALALSQYGGQDRVFMFSDVQDAISGRYDGYSRSTRDNRGTDGRYGIPANVPLYVFNLGGYGNTSVEAGKNNTYELGGLSDKVFSMISMLEAGVGTSWPWE